MRHTLILSLLLIGACVQNTSTDENSDQLDEEVAEKIVEDMIVDAELVEPEVLQEEVLEIATQCQKATEVFETAETFMKGSEIMTGSMRTNLAKLHGEMERACNHDQ